MQNIKELTKKFFQLNYIKFGIIVTITYIFELLIYSFLLNFYSIFYSNIIASFIGISIDYFVSTSKKTNLFFIEKSKKFTFYLLYIIHITLLIIFLSWLIEFINFYLQKPILSKIIVIPIGFGLNYFFFLVAQKKKVK